MSETGARFRGSSSEWRIAAEQVHGLALRVEANRTLAADLAQSVLKCLVERGAEVVNVVAWARKALLRLHAKTVRRQAGTEPLVEETTLSVAPAAEFRAQLLEILALLPERDRLLLSWSAQGLVHREIAGRLGCRTGDIGTMLGRARNRARSLSSSKVCQRTSRDSSHSQKT